MSFLFNDWFLIPAVGICAFVITYLWSEKIIQFTYKKSIGQREEIIRLLDSMFVDINEKRITILLSLLSFGLGAIFFLLFWPNVLVGALFAVIMTFVGWNLPLILIKSIYEKRQAKFVDQMVDGLTIMANGIKSGLSVTQSMERVVENLKNPISQEFELVLSQIRIGSSVEEALSELAVRIPKADVQMFVTAINILKETGGNLAETFSTIVMVIRERQKIEKKIQALTAQGITQGLIITMVPFALMGVLMIVDPNFIKPMFNTTLGLILLFAMLSLQIIGGLMIRKIVNIRV